MERIGGDVRRELSRFGSATQLGDLVARWPSAVGESIARNAWPARIQRDGTLDRPRLVVGVGVRARRSSKSRRARVPRGPCAARIRFVPGPAPGGRAGVARRRQASVPTPSAEARAAAAEHRRDDR